MALGSSEKEARQHSHLPLHALWILQTPTRDLFDLKHREVEKFKNTVISITVSAISPTICAIIATAEKEVQ